MDYEEFRRHLGKAKLTVKDFAKLVNLNCNSIYNCASKGAVPAQLAIISALLGEMAEHKVDFRAVLSRNEIMPNKPRGFGFGRQAKSAKAKGRNPKRSE